VPTQVVAQRWRDAGEAHGGGEEEQEAGQDWDQQANHAQDGEQDACGKRDNGFQFVYYLALVNVRAKYVARKNSSASLKPFFKYHLNY